MSDAAAAGAAKTFWMLDGVVTAVACDPASTIGAAALGTGEIRWVDLARPVAGKTERVQPHRGAILALAGWGEGFASGGDDGRLILWRPGSEPVERLKLKGWIEHLAVLPDGGLAAAAGRRIVALGPDGGEREFGPHPSTVAGLAAGSVGGRAVLAAAHYGGATLWDLADGTARAFAWKGSHVACALSPDGRHLATAMQDAEVHAWRLDDGSDMRMAGYPGKVASLAWTADGLLLATSGAPTIACWPFDGAGPEGRPPYEFGAEGEALVRLVAAHPAAPLIAAGLDDGMAAIADLASGRVGRIPVSKKAPVTALAWSPDGAHLLTGAEDGRLALFTAPALRRAAA